MRITHKVGVLASLAFLSLSKLHAIDNPGARGATR